jgi:hypothetical protein
MNREILKYIDVKKLSGMVIDTNEFIEKYNIQRVSSYRIYDVGTKTYDRHGLFSEFIFGNMVSDQRFEKYGYIDLHANILQPIVFFILRGPMVAALKLRSSSLYFFN